MGQMLVRPNWDLVNPDLEAHPARTVTPVRAPRDFFTEPADDRPFSRTNIKSAETPNLGVVKTRETGEIIIKMGRKS